MDDDEVPQADASPSGRNDTDPNGDGSGVNQGDQSEQQAGGEGESKDDEQDQEEGSGNPVESAPGEWKQQLRQLGKNFLPLPYWYLDCELDTRYWSSSLRLCSDSSDNH